MAHRRTVEARRPRSPVAPQAQETRDDYESDWRCGGVPWSFGFAPVDGVSCPLQRGNGCRQCFRKRRAGNPYQTSIRQNKLIFASASGAASAASTPISDKAKGPCAFRTRQPDCDCTPSGTREDSATIESSSPARVTEKKGTLHRPGRNGRVGGQPGNSEALGQQTEFKVTGRGGHRALEHAPHQATMDCGAGRAAEASTGCLTGRRSNRNQTSSLVSLHPRQSLAGKTMVLIRSWSSAARLASGGTFLSILRRRTAGIGNEDAGATEAYLHGGDKGGNCH